MKRFFTLISISLFSLTASAVPKLSSFPSATATIFLDFDGHTVQSTVWNGGVSFYCAESGLTEAQMTEAFYRVAEDYRPFNVNITTDSTVFLAAPLNRRVRIIITTTSAWCPGVGGVAYVGSFTWGDDTPGFVFSDRLGPFSPKMVGEACSHESGHTVGLAHQSRYGANCSTPEEQYNSGAGSGETGWSPIMGNSYYRNMSNWNNGPTPYGCTNMQDNLSIITTQSGFGYRPDDYTEALNATAYALPSTNFTVNGIITTNADKDAFRLGLVQSSNVHITVIPFNVANNYIGANLDVKLELYNNAGSLLRTYDPAATMSVTIDTVLDAGTYYLKIDGTGNTNIGEYGSLGAYTISGTSGALPIHAVNLSGSTDKARHNLSWNIIADEPIKSIRVELSENGTDFSELTSVMPSARNFSYNPGKAGILYYRLKLTSVLGQEVYSNTLALKGTNNIDPLFYVSTFIRQEIAVNAPGNYRYCVADMNGRIIATGNGPKGLNRIDMRKQPDGMYIIQLITNNTRQTERIIKQ
ncbi:MAG TPA: zinc-dependent metalloprotease [Ferruginibacter sp.]|nr:zinc-dependent metalloprotease [Ferruginibacter sp.]